MVAEGEKVAPAFRGPVEEHDADLRWEHAERTRENSWGVRFREIRSYVEQLTT
jgi:hypothetical protein